MTLTLKQMARLGGLATARKLSKEQMQAKIHHMNQMRIWKEWTNALADKSKTKSE